MWMGFTQPTKDLTSKKLGCPGEEILPVDFGVSSLLAWLHISGVATSTIPRVNSLKYRTTGSVPLENPDRDSS